MLIRSHTLGIRRVRSKYAEIRRCTLCYTQRPNYILDMFKMYQRMSYIFCHLKSIHTPTNILYDLIHFHTGHTTWEIDIIDSVYLHSFKLV